MRNNKELIHEIIGNDSFSCFCLLIIEVHPNIAIKKKDPFSVNDTPTAVPKIDNWTCKMCNFVNNSKKKRFCTTCGNKNPNQEGWICEFCKVKNKPLIRSCTTCDSRRPDNYEIPKDYVPTDRDELAILERDKEADTSIEIFLV